MAEFWQSSGTGDPPSNRAALIVEEDAGIAPRSGISAGPRALNLILAGSLVSGVVCFLGGAGTRKPLSIAMSVAHGALRLGDLQFPSLRGLIITVKLMIKGYKASKRFHLVGSTQQTESSSSASFKRLVAYFRALKVVRNARNLLLPERAAELGFLKSCYKLSKNLSNVSEDFSGERFDSSLRKILDAVALSIKITLVAVELERSATGARPRNYCHFRSARSSGSRHAVRSRLPHRTEIKIFTERNCSNPERFSSPIDLSGLLCLSIPLDQSMNIASS